MAWPAGYTILPLLPNGTFAAAYAVSGNGLVAVGEADDFTAERAVYWTESTGPIDLGFLPGGTYAIAEATNSDGSVIVGLGDATDGRDHAWRWTEAVGMVALPAAAGQTNSYAYGISDDGTVIVGEFIDGSGHDHACYWLNSAAPVDIGYLPGGSIAWATAASSDGSVIVGQSDSDGGTRAFRWTQAGGMVDLGLLTGTNSRALAVSADGSVVAGAATIADDTTVSFRWTSGAGMVDLGHLGTVVHPSGADGCTDTIVVGRATDDDFNAVPFTWTEAGGMVALPLPDGGAASGYDAYAIALGGSVLVGDAPINQTPPDPPAYVVTPVLLNTPNAFADTLQWPSGTIFATPQSTGVMSLWIYGGTHEFLWVADDDGFGLGGMSFSVFSGSVGMSISDSLGRGMDASASWSAIITDNPCTLHVLVSYDLPGQHLQIYVNDTLIVDTHSVATSPVWPGGSRTWAAGIMYETPSAIDPGFQYYSDFWNGLTASFVDLTVEANRRKFINADLTPVYLGPTGAGPFGTSPQVYQLVPSGGVAADWLPNRGTAGGSFALSGAATLTLAGNPCIVPLSPITHAFVYGLTPSGPPPSSYELPIDITDASYTSLARPGFSAIFYPQPGKRR